MEAAGLVLLARDDLVSVAPPDLQRNPGAGDLAQPVLWAAQPVLLRLRARCSPDLDAGERLQGSSLAAEDGEVVVAAEEIGDRVERNRAGKKPRMTSDQQERLLPAHASADCVDPLRIDAQPRTRGAEDRRHASEVVDLPSPAPRVKRQTPPHSSRADHGEVAVTRELPPEIRVRAAAHAAPVRRDHERQRR